MEQTALWTNRDNLPKTLRKKWHSRLLLKGNLRSGQRNGCTHEVGPYLGLMTLASQVDKFAIHLAALSVGFGYWFVNSRFHEPWFKFHIFRSRSVHAPHVDKRTKQSIVFDG